MLFDDIDIQGNQTSNGIYSPPSGGVGRGAVLSLYELNQQVRAVLEDTLSEPVWIQAELSSVSTRGQHCYLEFVQKAEQGNTFIAKARGQIWGSKWALIRPYFEQTTGQPLSPGMQVMVLVEVTFHEIYGYALNVIDINTMPGMTETSLVPDAARAAGISFGDFCERLLKMAIKE